MSYLFSAFSARVIYPLSTCLLKRDRGGREEQRGRGVLVETKREVGDRRGKRPLGKVGIRSSVTNDSSWKFALAPCARALPSPKFSNRPKTLANWHLPRRIYFAIYQENRLFLRPCYRLLFSSGATIDVSGSAFQSSRRRSTSCSLSLPYRIFL